MLEKKIKNIFSFNGISLIIGIVGGLAGYFTILITEWNTSISLKWFVFTIYLSFTIILFLLKLLIDINDELKIKTPNSDSADLQSVPSNENKLNSKTNPTGFKNLSGLIV